MSRPRTIVIEAGALFTPFEEYVPGRLLIRDRSIEAAGPPDRVAAPPCAELIDASAFSVVPGFVDTHIHGCGGADVMSGTFEALNTISRALARTGTTSFLPTTLSSPLGVLTGIMEKLGALLAHPFEGAHPLGLHLEGPFICPGKRGTHNAQYVSAPDVELFQQWIAASRDSIRLLTVAPELDAIEGLISRAQQAGITVAMGHSNASLEQAVAAADRGVCYAVHTFNAMREFMHRDSGIIGAVLSDDRIFAEIIADGVHVAPEVVRIFSRCKPAARILLTTDAISATGMPDGQYKLGTCTVKVKSGICRDSDGRLAGSTLTQDRALRNFMAWTGLQFQEALLAVTANPAKAVGLRKGTLEPGADADVTVLNSDQRVIQTYVAGKLVFDCSGGL